MNIVETDGEQLLIALRSVLAAKGIASPAEIAERIASTDSASPGQGARMVAKAWTDPAYRARMLVDGSKAAEELGIPMRGMPPLGVLENSADVHNLIVRLRVVDSTADYRWMVLPLRPAGTEGWDVARLASIVREGDMIGVTIPKV